MHGTNRTAALLGLTALLGVAVLAAGCAADDGTTPTGTAASAAGGPTAAAPAGDALIATAVEEYHAYALDQVDEMIALTTVFTDAVRAGDLAAAQAAYAPSRVPWERIEPLAGLVEEIDGAVDARVDDFAGVDDPEFTGWHRLEYLLFELGTTDGAAAFADQLDADLATLRTELASQEVPPVAVPVGAAELIEEVSQGKITGEEDRYSKTDLWDFNANLEGSQAAIELLAPALREADPELLAEIESGFAGLQETLAPLRDGDGWQLYCLADDQFPSPRCPGVTVPPETVSALTA
ncbi:MAG: EfeM/EfeO family lipoprotein, partial [Pseudonocardia sp.]|nr:EfeM/EfeO family lipoprotein [Pseudonocardia sp.]